MQNQKLYSDMRINRKRKSYVKKFIKKHKNGYNLGKQDIMTSNLRVIEKKNNIQAQQQQNTTRFCQ